jgi:hypothetical protein
VIRLSKSPLSAGGPPSELPRGDFYPALHDSTYEASLPHDVRRNPQFQSVRGAGLRERTLLRDGSTLGNGIAADGQREATLRPPPFALHPSPFISLAKTVSRVSLLYRRSIAM